MIPIGKTVSVLILSLFLCAIGHAQKSGLIYYFKNYGIQVSTKDSADYSIVVFSPDTSVDKNMFVVYEYYNNGRVRLITNSYTNDANLIYQGPYIAYFANGRKKETGHFVNGRPTGHVVNYYPNGRVYNSKNYLPDEQIYLIDCRDSIGNELAEKGKGKWVRYNDNFTQVVAEGNIKEGTEDGEWNGSLNNYETFKSTYHKGELVNTEGFYKSVGDSIYTKVENVPSFPCGPKGFSKFLWYNIRYPFLAQLNGIQGKVNISFVIEKDGALTGAKISGGVDKIIDDEALRVMRLSPPWEPGTINGVAVRSAYSVLVSFVLSN